MSNTEEIKHTYLEGERLPNFTSLSGKPGETGQ